MVARIHSRAQSELRGGLIIIGSIIALVIIASLLVALVLAPDKLENTIGRTPTSSSTTPAAGYQTPTLQPTYQTPTPQPIYQPPPAQPSYARPPQNQAATGACPRGGSHVPGKTDSNGHLHCAKCGRFM